MPKDIKASIVRSAEVFVVQHPQTCEKSMQKDATRRHHHRDVSLSGNNVLYLSKDLLAVGK